MGQKVNPYGFRLGVTTDWKSRWFADRGDYSKFIIEDWKIRNYLMTQMPHAAISRVEVEAQGVERRFGTRLHRFGHPPGVRPDQQARQRDASHHVDQGVAVDREATGDRLEGGLFLAGGIERTTRGLGGVVRVEIGPGLLVVEAEVLRVDLDEAALVDVGQRDRLELVGLHRLEVVGADLGELRGFAEGHAQSLPGFLEAFAEGLHGATFGRRPKIGKTKVAAGQPKADQINWARPRKGVISHPTTS